MPSSLFNALIAASKQNKRVVFYTNPPYGTSKASIARSKINLIMKNNGCGKASQQL